MLSPTDAESQVLSVHHPWLARLRGSAHRCGDEENSFVLLVDTLQSQLLLRMRLLQELNEMRADADQGLKYARFVRSITEEDGIWVDAIPPYVDFMEQTGVIQADNPLFANIRSLILEHGLEDLLPALQQAHEDYSRKQELVVEMRDRIRAISETAGQTAQEINRARTALGLPSESFSLLDDSDAAEG